MFFSVPQVAFYFFPKALLCQRSSAAAPLSVCSKGRDGRKVNNKKAKGWSELFSSSFCHEPLSLFFESFFSCDRAQGPPCACFDQMHRSRRQQRSLLILPHGILGFGFQCTDCPVHKQQRGGRLCLCRTGGDRCVTPGPAVSMHECSRCSSQGRWESFRVTLNSLMF